MWGGFATGLGLLSLASGWIPLAASADPVPSIAKPGACAERELELPPVEGPPGGVAGPAAAHFDADEGSALMQFVRRLAGAEPDASLYEEVALVTSSTDPGVGGLPPDIDVAVGPPVRPPPGGLGGAISRVSPPDLDPTETLANVGRGNPLIPDADPYVPSILDIDDGRSGSPIDTSIIDDMDATLPDMDDLDDLMDDLDDPVGSVPGAGDAGRL